MHIEYARVQASLHIKGILGPGALGGGTDRDPATRRFGGGPDPLFRDFEGSLGLWMLRPATGLAQEAPKRLPKTPQEASRAASLASKTSPE